MASKGNNPILWDKLLTEVEEKLQLGLLDHLKRVLAYHFEGDVLIIEPSNAADKMYFEKPAITQTLKLFGEKVAGVTKVRIGSGPS